MKGIRLAIILSVVCITTVFALAKPSSLAHQSCPFKENIHYKIITPTVSDTAKITELFSVYCATCYLWEKGILEQVKEKLSSNEVVFEQAHSSIAGQFAKQISTILAIAKLNNHYEETKKLLFRIIQLERKKWATEQDFFKTMETIGFSYEFYKKHEMNLQVVQYLMAWNEISNLTDIVPSLIISNKYLILTHKVKNIDELERIIFYLLELSKK
jgi:thiol:disulfide interchange protein DsbA